MPGAPGFRFYLYLFPSSCAYLALCKDSLNIRWMNGCLRSRNPLCWISLEPGLWVLWKHGSAWLGCCPRANGRRANAGARGTPRIPQLRRGGRMRMSQARRHKANHCATYPGPGTERQHANSQFWNGWGAGCFTSSQRPGGKPEAWSSCKAEVPVSPWILPVLASTHRLWTETGRREE